MADMTNNTDIDIVGGFESKYEGAEVEALLDSIQSKLDKKNYTDSAHTTAQFRGWLADGTAGTGQSNCSGMVLFAAGQNPIFSTATVATTCGYIWICDRQDGGSAQNGTCILYPIGYSMDIWGIIPRTGNAWKTGYTFTGDIQGKENIWTKLNKFNLSPQVKTGEDEEGAPIYSNVATDNDLNTKQNVISDLNTIRSGAALGATSVQQVAGKGLSTNDYTDADKQKVANSLTQDDIANEPGYSTDKAISQNTFTQGWESLAQNIANQVERLDDSITELDNSKEDISNKTTTISSSSTNTQYPGALAVYNAVNGKADKYNVQDSTSATIELQSNKFYRFGEMASLTITLATPTDTTIVNEYHFIFTSGTTATTLSLPTGVVMPSGFNVEASKTYEISIVDNKGVYAVW